MVELGKIQYSRLMIWLATLAIFLFCPYALSFSPYSTKELESIEKEFVALINQSNTVERSPLTSQYINHLGKSLAQQADMQSPYFFIVKSNEINAFAGPGGYIGINTRLILATENESELAAVMAHELAHVRQHHLYQMLEHSKQARIPTIAAMLASIALGIVNPALGTGAMMASMGGFAQDSINYIRAHEKEADRIGIDMLIQSGIDPKGMPAFFKKMQENSRYYYTADIPAILRTHPLDEERISEAENRIFQLKKRSYKSSDEYYFFKEFIRVSTAENMPSLIQYYEKNHPQTKEQAVAHQYGHALNLVALNQYEKARQKLLPLRDSHPDNLYINTAYAKAELGLNQSEQALETLATAYANAPDNYAATIIYAEALMDTNHSQQALDILLPASRKYPKDLSLCYRLARAQANTKQLGYAYFTRANCMVLQGKKTEAVKQLKHAESLAAKNSLLKAQVQARLEEIKNS